MKYYIYSIFPNIKKGENFMSNPLTSAPVYDSESKKHVGKAEFILYLVGVFF